MSDVKLEFDLVTGKNEVNKSIDSIKSSAKSTQNSLSNMLLGISSKNNEIEKSAEKMTDKFESGFSTIKVGALGAIGAITGLAYSAKQFIDAAIESEQSVSRLEVALKQTGIYSESASKKFQDLASKIQDTTVYSDDQVLSATSLLQTLGQLTDEGLEKATKATVNLASSLKIDLESAATLVAKAANGNTESLRRQGVEIRKGKTDAETFANTLEALSRFQGASNAEVKTLGGSFKFLGNQIGEAAETIGKIISETLHLKEATIAAANAIKEQNNAIKEDSLRVQAENTKIAAAGYENLADSIDQSIDAYERLKASRQKSANEARFATEEFLKANKDISKALDPFEGFSAKNNSVKLLSEIGKEAPSKSDLLETQARKDEAKKLQDERIKQANELAFKNKKAYEDLLNQVKNVGKTQEKIIEDEYKERKANLDNLFKTQVVNEKQFQELSFLYAKDSVEKIGKVKAEQSDKERKLEEERQKLQRNTVLSGFSNVLSGTEGAKNLLTSVSGAIGESLLPGSGGQIGAIVGQLSQGAEANREMIKQFAQAVPVLIDGIIQSIPAVIDELAIQFPRVIESMQKTLTSASFWETFAKNLGKAAVNLATMQAKAFINYIPEFFSSFGKNLIDAIVEGVSSAASSVGDVAGGFLKSIPVVGDIADALGLARGGQVLSVPNSFPNDTFNARLTSGELVVDRSTAQRLNDFLDGNNMGESSISDALLVKILDKLSQPISVATKANINGRAFADIILELNRTNQRLTI